MGLVGKRPLPTFRSTLAAKGWGRTAWFSVLREGRGLVSSWLLLCPPRLAEGRATAMRDAAGGLVLRPAPPTPAANRLCSPPLLQDLGARVATPLLVLMSAQTLFLFACFFPSATFLITKVEPGCCA